MRVPVRNGEARRRPARRVGPTAGHAVLVPTPAPTRGTWGRARRPRARPGALRAPGTPRRWVVAWRRSSSAACLPLASGLPTCLLLSMAIRDEGVVNATGQLRCQPAGVPLYPLAGSRQARSHARRRPSLAPPAPASRQGSWDSGGPGRWGVTRLADPAERHRALPTADPPTTAMLGLLLPAMCGGSSLTRLVVWH